MWRFYLGFFIICFITAFFWRLTIVANLEIAICISLLVLVGILVIWFISEFPCESGDGN